MEEVVEGAVEEHQVRHVEMRKVAVGQEAVARPSRCTCDELMLVVAQEAIHRPTEHEDQTGAENSPGHKRCESVQARAWHGM